MWNFALLTAVAAMAGYYALLIEQGGAAVADARTAHLAAQMATYRSAVLTYARTHPGTPGQVATADLMPLLPASFSAASAENWRNYIDASKMTYVFAATPLTMNIVADVIKIAGNPLQVGSFVARDGTMRSPVYGELPLPIPSAILPQIPDGSPLWLGRSS